MIIVRIYHTRRPLPKEWFNGKEELEKEVTNAAKSITREQCHLMFEEYKRRILQCVQVGGNYFALDRKK